MSLHAVVVDRVDHLLLDRLGRDIERACSESGGDERRRSGRMIW